MSSRVRSHARVSAAVSSSGPERQACVDRLGDVGLVQRREARDRRSREEGRSRRRRARRGSRRPARRPRPRPGTRRGSPPSARLRSWRCTCLPARCSIIVSIQPARSRTSMTCIGRSGGPGATIVPPRATRLGQYDEAVGRVVRPDDEAGSNDERALAEHVVALRARRAPSAGRSSETPRRTPRRSRPRACRPRSTRWAARRDPRRRRSSRRTCSARPIRRAPPRRRARSAGSSRTCRRRRPTRDRRARTGRRRGRPAAARPRERARGSSARG